MTAEQDKERGEPIRRDRSVGVIYVAIGPRFVPEASLSANSVRRFLPDVPILLFTDQAIEAAHGFDATVQLHAPHPKVHINKLIAMTQSPFEKTLLLDTDTYVCADISDLFAMLERFDIAMSQDRAYREVFPANSGVPDGFVEFNQGVIAFRRSDAAREALQEALSWTETLHARSGVYPYDQAPLRIALFHSEVRVATLPLEYNCRFASYGYLNGVVRILHGRLPNGPMRTEDFDRIARALNRVTVPRVFIVGAVFAMRQKSLLGRSYWTRTQVGQLYRPCIVLLGYAVTSLRNGVRNEGLASWLRRMAKRLFAARIML
jgi:hypothetical protein